VTARRADRRYRCARCGFVGEYEKATATEARYWFRRHSCRKHEEAMVRSAIAAEREAKVDREPKPCLHKQANHQHGTRACYVLDKCRCLPCAAANSNAESERERQKAYGRYNKYVPAGPVREHVAELQAAGMGLKTIIKRSGVPSGTMTKLVYGIRKDGVEIRPPARRVLRETAEKLYALDPAFADLELADGTAVPIEPYRTKVRALVALGWSQSKLAERMGIQRSNFRITRDEETHIRVSTAKAVDALFRELAMTLPPEDEWRDKIAASRARGYAARNGWLPPLALDDLDMEEADDAGGDIDEVAVMRRIAGDRSVRLTRAEKWELVRRWQASGRPVADCVKVTGLDACHYNRRAREAS
jgi:transcriptional regulator with XRE-family HTH domain